MPFNLKAKIILIVIISFFSSFNSDILYSQTDTAEFSPADKIRIREVLKISKKYGNSVWKNFDSAPFAIILVAGNNEYLMNHSNPTDEFTSLGFDSTVGSEIFVRPSQFSNNMLATFPAVNGVPTIVVGQPKYTSRHTMDWIITLLHEHLHQMQMAQPDYYVSVNSLDLSGGDESGMWMLNYDFPYKDEKISKQYYILTQSAKDTYMSFDVEDFIVNLKKYLSERAKFKSMLNEKDYKYFSFQLWQEGLARYTEIRFAKKLNEEYTPSNEITKMDDFMKPEAFYEKMIEKLMRRADTQILSNDGRNCFYTLGAIEGLLLDIANPGWQEFYFKEKFETEKYFSSR